MVKNFVRHKITCIISWPNPSWHFLHKLLREETPQEFKSVGGNFKMDQGNIGGVTWKIFLKINGNVCLKIRWTCTPCSPSYTTRDGIRKQDFFKISLAEVFLRKVYPWENDIVLGPRVGHRIGAVNFFGVFVGKSSIIDNKSMIHS